MYCQRLHIWHVYPSTETLSNDTQLNDFVTLTVAFILKKANSDFVAIGCLRMLQTHLFDMLHIFWQSTVAHFIIRKMRMFYYKAFQLHTDL